MAKSTITYKIKFKWYAHPVAFVLWFFTDNCIKDWMYTLELEDK
jgi:hypothetical protein